MKKIAILVLILGLSIPAFALSEYDISSAYYKSYNYEKMGNYNDAINALSLVVKTFPTAYTVNVRLGYLNSTAKRYANAIQHYDTAIQTAPSALEPKLGKMLVLMNQARYSEAEQLGNQILNSDYNNYYANLRLAYCLRMQKKNELAEKVALKMLTLYPIDASLLNEYGSIKYAQASYQKAYAIFADVLVLEPENVTAKYYVQMMKDASAKK